MITRIKDISDQKKISYMKIAKEMGVTKQTITNWTTGQRQITLSDLEKIAEILKCEVVELLNAPESYDHIYTANGEWLGIRKNQK